MDGRVKAVVGIIGICMVFIASTEGQTSCSFPSDIRGNWTSSRKGSLEFNETHIFGRIMCSADVCSNEAFAEWSCIESSDDRYLIKSGSYFDFGTYNGYVCLYIYKISATKYLYYHGPNDKNVAFGDYVSVAIDTNAPTLADTCNLPTPFPTDRYHLLVKEDSILTSSSFCSNDLLGNFVGSDPSSCNATMEVCGDKNSIQVLNSTTNPDLFLSKNGSLKCMYSLRDDTKSITYLTVFNEDTLSVGDTGFVCVAIYKDDDQVSITQQAHDCIDLASPNVTTPICAFNNSSINCQFASGLTGSWFSTRKGEVSIAGDTMTGFESYGVDCNSTTCSSAPTTFECYMTSDDKYLLRTSPTSINSMSVRIYVCLQFTLESTNKYVYYHDHAALHDSLDEYVITLNAATPVDSITEVCESLSSFNPALYTVLVKSDSLSSTMITCPNDFNKIYNISNSQCEYTMGTCDNDKEIKVSPTTCNNLPFYSANGTLNCLYKTTSGSTTYLTLYNLDSTYTDGSTYMFTCLAYELPSTKSLRFSQTPLGCNHNQTTTAVSTNDGLTFAFDNIGDCPVDEFDWLLIVIILAAIILLIIIIVIIWVCCCRKKRAKKGDEENIKDDISVQTKSSEEDDVEGKGGPRRNLVDSFTVGKKKDARVRKMEKSKLKHRRGRHKDEENSVDSGVTNGSSKIDEDGDEDAIHKKKKRRKRRKKKKMVTRTLEDGTVITEEVEVSTDGDDDDGYTNSDYDYSDSFDSDDSYDSDFSNEESKKRHQISGSKLHSLHIAKAWEKRKLDPSLIKSTGSPIKGRPPEGDNGLDHDPRFDLLPGQIMPIASIMAKGRQLRNKDRLGSSMSSARSANLRHYMLSPTRKKSTIDERLEEGRQNFAHNIPHLGLYIDYTDKRQQMEDEGFWDDMLAPKNAYNIFNFQELDNTLTQMDDVTDPKVNDEKASVHGSVSRPSTTTRRSAWSSDPGKDDAKNDVTTNNGPGTRPPSQQGAMGGDKDMGKTENSENHSLNEEENESNSLSFDEAEIPVEKEITSPSPKEKVTFVGASNLMARFYSRLKEIRSTKGDVEAVNENSNPTPGSGTEKTDKRRIRTALRRLLTDRLFPDIRPATPVKPLPGDNESIDNLTLSDSATPYPPLGPRSKSTFSILSKAGDDTRASTAANKKRVLVVESSDDFKHNDAIGESGGNKQETQGYYIRHEGHLKRGNISRLYQPAKSNRDPPVSTRDVILRDPEFIRSLRTEIGKYNDKTEQTSNTKRSNRPNLSWAYNQQKPRPGLPTAGWNNPRGNLNKKDMEDWQLKKLLEEMYKDKKYMDTLITTKGDNPTEEDVTKQLESGREYLLERAAYWLEKGPLPSRPPTSALALRLEREQTALSIKSINSSKNKIEPNKATDSSSSFEDSRDDPEGNDSSKGDNRENESNC